MSILFGKHTKIVLENNFWLKFSDRCTPAHLLGTKFREVVLEWQIELNKVGVSVNCFATYDWFYIYCKKLKSWSFPFYMTGTIIALAVACMTKC